MKRFYCIVLLFFLLWQAPIQAEEEHWTEPSLSANALLFLGLVAFDASYSQNKVWLENGITSNGFVSPDFYQGELMYFTNYTPRMLTFGFSVGVDYLEYLDDVRNQFTGQLQTQRFRFAGPASEVSLGWENSSLSLQTFARYGVYGGSGGVRLNWTVPLSRSWIMDTNLEFSSAPGTFGDQVNGYTAFLYPLDAVSSLGIALFFGGTEVGASVGYTVSFAY
ncbi:MAG: hypothetical protein AAF518_20330 [Spirochaetota bacterium]